MHQCENVIFRTPLPDGRSRSTRGSILCQLSRTMILMLVIMIGAFATTVAADTTYVCTPSGFTVGVPPFRAVTESFTSRSPVRTLPLEKLRERLAESLVNSHLFTEVVLLKEGPAPDSTDLTLLVSVPVARQVSESDPATYEFTFDVMLIEHAGGEQIFRARYDTLYESRYNRSIRDAHRFDIEMEIVFLAFVPRIVTGLDGALNAFPSMSVTELASGKRVRHTHLEPLWLAPTIVQDPSPALLNYAGYIKDRLRDRLERKNCFSFADLPDGLESCFINETSGTVDDVQADYRNCHPEWAGMIVLIMLSDQGEQMRFRSVLLMSPEMQVLYDRTLSTRPGWRLTNSLESHAAGIAQSAHTVPH